MVSIIFCLFALFNTSQGQAITEIEFGSGGGFTGAIEAYALKADGSLYRVNSFQETRILLKNIDLKTTRAIFQKIETSELMDYHYDLPGNTYKFISINAENYRHKITWNGKSENNTLNLIYSELNALCKLNE